jgi:hypothetical protein
MSDKHNASQQPALYGNRTSRLLLFDQVELSLHDARRTLTKPVAPRLLTSILPQVRGRRTTPSAKPHSADYSAHELRALFPAPVVPTKSRSISPDVRFCDSTLIYSPVQ